MNFSLYCFMNSDKCMDSYNYHNNQDTESSLSSKIILYFPIVVRSTPIP